MPDEACRSIAGTSPLRRTCMALPMHAVASLGPIPAQVTLPIACGTLVRQK